MSEKSEQQTKQWLGEALTDPVLFAQRVLHHKTWRVQEEILHAVAEHPRVAVKAGHSLSKSFAAAELLLWWLVRYKDGVVLTTGPTARQVESVIWSEVRKALKNNPLVRLPAPNQASLKISEGNFAMGFSTSSENAGVNMSGFKSERLLIVIDEAVGVEGPIWESIDGALATGDTHLLTLCNPLVPGGPVYESFTRNRAQNYCITIDALDSPNLEGCPLDELRALPPGLADDGTEPHSGRKITDIFDYRPWPQLASRFWVYEMLCKHGERSPWWQARVRGQFPEQAEDSLYPLSWLERARGGYIDNLEHYETVIIGIDVAGPGKDETVCVVRAGNRKLASKGWHDPDPRGDVLAFLQPWRGRIKVANVDSTGIGYYFCSHLADNGVPVNYVNFGAASEESKKRRTRPPDNRDRQYEVQFADLKAEMYWKTREVLEACQLVGLDDEEISQATGIRFEYLPDGEVKIESKEKRRRRNLPSPDRWEAIVLAWGVPTVSYAYDTPRRAPQGPYAREDSQNYWGRGESRARSFGGKGSW